MPTLPAGARLNPGVAMAEYPTKTWKIDQDSKRLASYCDGLEAMKQAVEAALSVRRFQWQIYSPNFGWDGADLVGQDAAYVSGEIRRRVSEALSVDRRITGIKDYQTKQTGDTLTATFTVTTVYGDIGAEVMV